MQGYDQKCVKTTLQNQLKSSENSKQKPVYGIKWEKRRSFSSTQSKKIDNWIRLNNCLWFKALEALNLKYLKDLSTMNQQILGNMVTGKEKESKRILTTKEEESVAYYFVNRNHAMLRFHQ